MTAVMMNGFLVSRSRMFGIAQSAYPSINAGLRHQLHGGAYSAKGQRQVEDADICQQLDVTS